MRPFHVIIPARYQSKRLPGKPLLKISGKTMIEHVVNRAKESHAKTIVVATDDKRIKEEVEKFGGTAIMTSTDHETGSDRISEAVKMIGLDDEAIIVNVQGDEPDISPSLINQVVKVLNKRPKAVMATALAPLENEQQLNDPSIVKVVTNVQNYAIYFSRSAIPWGRKETSTQLEDGYETILRRHLGIYSYSSGYIQEFAKRKPCRLEKLEKLEQLRVLWYGEYIACEDAYKVPYSGVNSKEDLLRVRQFFKFSTMNSIHWNK